MLTPDLPVNHSRGFTIHFLRHLFFWVLENLQSISGIPGHRAGYTLGQDTRPVYHRTQSHTHTHSHIILTSAATHVYGLGEETRVTRGNP